MAPLFDSVGFSWRRDSIPRQLPRASIERAAFRFSRIRELNPELSLVRDAPAFRYYRFDDPVPQAEQPSVPA